MKDHWKQQMYAREAAIEQLQGTTETLASLKSAFVFYGGQSAVFSYYLGKALDELEEILGVVEREGAA
mgnify:CR=1 FL=1